MSTGENIRKIRKQKGLTQKKLAELTGLNEVTIRSYELGKFNPKLESMKKIADALGVTVGDLDDYSTMLQDKEDALNLQQRLNEFLAKILESDIPEENKKDNVKKINELLESIKNLASTIDIAILKDKEMSQALKELSEAKQELMSTEQELYALILYSYNLLNYEGQEKFLDQMNLLLQIPKYRKDQ